MRVFLLSFLSFLALSVSVYGQQQCYSHEYQLEQFANNPDLRSKVAEIENFILNNRQAQRLEGNTIIKIPVVVHILYHSEQGNVSNLQVHNQIKALNDYFRRQHADTANTPERFRSVAADCQIEFQLASSDPRRRGTTGIIRKYTPVLEWEANDKMKFSSETGDDAWDATKYLNIWVVNLKRMSGYASFPGGPNELDGVVLDLSAFGLHPGSNYSMGKTAVHEVGHWLGLKHIWGDDYCGDDQVDDTPVQNNFTMGCPSGLRTSCGNNPDGDMYMNYMDVTLDACTNLFTEGQKSRMHTLFAPGGARYGLLTSPGLLPPLIGEIPIDEAPPTWLHPQLYPNPATDEVILDLSYDIRWVGKTLRIMSSGGHTLMLVQVTEKIQRIPVSKLAPGLYFLAGKKEDGASVMIKFIKR